MAAKEKIDEILKLSNELLNHYEKDSLEYKNIKSNITSYEWIKSKLK